jgi:hypothetical protein
MEVMVANIAMVQSPLGQKAKILNSWKYERKFIAMRYNY